MTDPRLQKLLCGLVAGAVLALAVAGRVLAPTLAPPPPDPAHSALVATGLVEITYAATGIVVDLPYATASNFMGRPVYPSNRAYAVPELVEALVRVQARLADAGLGLKVWDAYRPFRVQAWMWEALPDPVWVGTPTRGSAHNRGAAVDVTLVDREGRELELPTAFDEFSPRAHIDYGGHTPAARANLALLRAAMLAEGFRDYPPEWWHFSLPDPARFPVLDLELPGPGG